MTTYRYLIVTPGVAEVQKLALNVASHQQDVLLISKIKSKGLEGIFIACLKHFGVGQAMSRS